MRTMLEGITDPQGEKKIITRARLRANSPCTCNFFFFLPSVSSGQFESSKHVNK